MSSENDSSSGDKNPFEDMFRQLFGQGGGQMPDLSALFGQGGQAGAGGFDMAALAPMMQQMSAMMSGQSPEQMKRTAMTRASAQIGSDPAPDDAQREQVREAFRLADLWLDEVTDLSPVASRALALRKVEWVERTLGPWRTLAEPIQEGMDRAVSEALTTQAPEELRPMLAGATPMLRSLSSSMFTMQMGEAVGTLSNAVLSTTELGFPLLAEPDCGLISSTVDAFAEEAEIDTQELRILLALRELAVLRLFAHAPWLRAHVESTLQDYARGQHFDTDRINEVATQIDPNNLESIQEKLREGIFAPATSPEQKRSLERLETLLALIEGWVDVVSYEAASRLGDRERIREAIRRRRAAGGPAEKTFASLVGLELRPRRLRDAAALFGSLEQSESAAARDAVWDHPDLLPDTQDLDDPLGYRERRRAAEERDSAIDDELAKLLDAAASDGTDGGPADGVQDASDAEADGETTAASAPDDVDDEGPAADSSDTDGGNS